MQTENEQLAFFLDRVTQVVEYETEFLDVLAQLEYVGCRKIMKSVGFGQVDASLLQHLQEEATHALLLKRNAERRGLKRSWEHSKLGVWGWEYFQTVDHAVSGLVEAKAGVPSCAGEGYPPCYQMVSFAIEERVLWLYPAYIERTKDENVRRSLETILAQEKHHGERFRNYEGSEMKSRATSLERQAWAALMEKLTNWVTA